MPNLIVAEGISAPGSGAAGWNRSAVSALAGALRASIAANGSELSVEIFRQVHRRMGLGSFCACAMRGAASGAFSAEQAACQTKQLLTLSFLSPRIDAAPIFCILYAKWSFSVRLWTYAKRPESPSCP